MQLQILRVYESDIVLCGKGKVPVNMGQFNLLFDATVEATEEAVLNALFRATTVSGIDGHILYELPIERTQDILHKYGRL
jgi:L-aminopeptidase/D-esterase-like protein